jgi:uncharacterized membrane protein
MDSLILIGLLAVVGWGLGIVGFFRASRALRELRMLRAELARPEPIQPRPPAGSVPEVRPTPVEAAPADIPASDLPLPGLPPDAPRARPDIEALLTQRWGIWLGAVALLFAGVFLIRYAAEQGLLGPAARCSVAAGLGAALLAAAEWLRRRPADHAITLRFGTDQAPAGLAAGGIGVLFGAAYGAGAFYGLLPPLLTFPLLGLTATFGMLISLRFGPLVAAVGIVGAFITPALVHTEAPSLPGLFAYLLAVTACALAVLRYSAWRWLGWAATIAAAVWVMLAASMPQARLDAWAPALFVPAAAALNLFLLPAAALNEKLGRRLAWILFAVLGAAGLLLESIVPDPVSRIALLLLSPIAVAKAAREPRLDRLPWLAALLGLLSLLLWALPEWQPTGEVIQVETIVEAVLPGAWAPDVIIPLLTAAAALAFFHAAAGLWFERRTPSPLPWSALVAGVPVLTLAVTYAQVARFQPDPAWAATALALAAALIANAALAARTHAPQRAGVHAAGTVAALSLGCAILLHDHWITLAISLFLPALAWIEARADLPPLRKVALAVAAVVTVRLVLNWYVLAYPFGATPIVNGLLPAYGVPALAFAAAAIMFRRRADDLAVAILEAGAVAFAAILVALEVRHWASGGRMTHGGSFHEATLHVFTLAAQATLLLYVSRRPVLAWAWRIEGGIALAGGILLLLGNPGFGHWHSGSLPLLTGYLAPAILAALAARKLPQYATLLGAYALVAGFAWIGLQIQQVVPGAAPEAALWALSGGWLLYGIGLMAWGLYVGHRRLRLAALAIIGLVGAKVFLIDMAGLTGLWRVVSFLGLGISLIGLGNLYRRAASRRPTQV